MSVFKVKLNNPQQGYLDYDPRTQSVTATPPLGEGSQMQPSIQRSIYVAGPHGTYRQLKDGVTFTDCNYWKRFAFPQAPLDQAFIEVVTDDGSVYSDNSEENTFGVVFGGDTAYSVLTTDTFATKYIDILGTYGGVAKFVQIESLGSSSPSQDIKIQLSGSTSAIMKLKAGDSQVFNAGDLAITKLAFQGGSSNVDLQIILSVKVVCTS